MKAYGALEDDKRAWDKSRRKLLEKSLTDGAKKAVKEGELAIDWDRVEVLATEARGVPVSVIVPDASTESVLLAARKVENEVPEGANWDGKVEVDEEKFQELLSDREPEVADAQPSGSGAAAKPTGRAGSAEWSRRA